MGTQQPQHTPPERRDHSPKTRRVKPGGHPLVTRLGDPWLFTSGSTRLLPSEAPSLPRGLSLP